MAYMLCEPWPAPLKTPPLVLFLNRIEFSLPVILQKPEALSSMVNKASILTDIMKSMTTLQSLQKNIVITCLSVSSILFSEIALTEESAAKSVYISQIESWHAPNDKELIIKTKVNTYRASFTNSCAGLSTAYTVAFITQQNKHLDSSSSVRLPDGLRCNFNKFSRLCEGKNSC